MTNEVALVVEKTHREIIKDMYSKDLTDSEFEAFMMLCNKTKLDPVAKQIYVMKKGDRMSTIVSIDGYRLIAERTGRYVPGREPTHAYNEKGTLVSSTAYVKKLAADGSWHEVGATALLAEYRKNTGIWPTMPHVMLDKCAESLALRRAFPNDLSGLYTEEEMGLTQADVVVTNKKPNLMTKPETVVPLQIEDAATPYVKPYTIDDLMVAATTIGLDVKKSTMTAFVLFLRDSKNAKGGTKVTDVEIVQSAMLPGNFDLFAKKLKEYLGQTDSVDDEIVETV